MSGDTATSAPHDAALTVAVVVEVGAPPVVDHQERFASFLERCVAHEAFRVDHGAAHEQEVQEPLLGSVGERREVRQVGDDGGDGRQVGRRHAPPVHSAAREPEASGPLHVADLVPRPQQPMAVQGPERRPYTERDVAHERHLHLRLDGFWSGRSSSASGST